MFCIVFGDSTVTHCQRKFVDFYLDEARGNATQAARLAAYRWPRSAGPSLPWPTTRPGRRAAFHRVSQARHAPRIMAGPQPSPPVNPETRPDTRSCR